MKVVSGYGSWVMGIWHGAWGMKQRAKTLCSMLFALCFLLLTHHSSLVTASHAQPVFSPGSPALWDSQDVEPGAVIKDGDLYKMWFTGYDSKSYRIGYAQSKDGINWDKYDKPVFDIGNQGEWDSFSVAYPSVIKDGNMFKMWYTGSTGKTLSVGYAVSRDGIQWERQKSPVFEPAEEDVWDGFSIMYPMVIKSGSRYMMWYVGSAGVSYKIGMAVSDDGIKWKRDSRPIDFGNIHSFHPWVIKIQGQGMPPQALSGGSGGKSQGETYKMWYSVKETPKSGFHIFSAHSKDGIKWETKGEILQPNTGWDIKEVFKPVVLQDDSGYKMWHAGFDGRRTRIGFASSIDGNKWTRYEENPVLETTDGSGWDGQSVFRGSIIRDDNIYKIWYSGFNGNKTKIGMAFSNDGIKWHKALLPVFSPVNDWERFGVGYPFILKEGKTYKMWYTGFNGTILQIGYAQSNDGINWERRKKPVLKPYKDKIQIAYPYVVKENALYRMYYVAYSKGSTDIETATSKDGINWGRQTEKPLITEKAEIMSPWVIKQQGQGAGVKGQEEIYRMWYSVYGENGYEIHYASSLDGIEWKKYGSIIKPEGMLKGLSGPMVVKEENKYKMWYEEFTGSKTGISLAFSDDGIIWQRYDGPICIDPGAKDGWDSFGVAGGWIIKSKGQGSGGKGQGETYKMWYSGHDGETFRIGYAQSKDGKDWERFDVPVFDKGTEGSWDDFQAAYPFVMKDGDRYKMWYYGYGRTPNHPPSIGYATSPDGVTWQRYKENPVLSPGEGDSWDNEMLGYPVIIKEDLIYKMWYAGTNRFGQWKIGYAQSKDGINWTKLLTSVIDNGEKSEWDGFAVSYPMVIRIENGYLMWYTGIDVGEEGRPAMRIGTAFSNDGVSWRKLKDNPKIDIGDKGEWNEASSFSPRVILDGSTWKIWFTGFDRDRVFRIGYSEKQ